MTNITAISNQKGGVGKTTVAVNLGKNLAGMGKKVLLIDNDPQGNLSMAIFGDDMPEEIIKTGSDGISKPGISNCFHLYKEQSNVKPYAVSETLHIIGSTKHLSEVTTKPFEVIFEFRDNIEAVRDQYDEIIIDCLPSFGVLQTAAHMTADHLLIPTHLEEFSVKGLEEQLQTANNTKRRLNPKLNFLGILANEVSAQKVLVEEHYYNDLKSRHNGHLFETKITKSAKIKESHALCKSIYEYKKNSDQARQYQEFTREYLERVDANG
ncbi:ParA family protein [Endozoicomonas sp. SM1973]|uniref:ParA family protein n=1 Tax=Spartinivicinus marinus TaxID=2994442 RepID=A0A853INR4_9GAMM|nr:ParA family protein [Spartinivicinus marinus]NYZ69496.1 ParA family protein [Spartinivicinus marinus]